MVGPDSFMTPYSGYVSGCGVEFLQTLPSKIWYRTAVAEQRGCFLSFLGVFCRFFFFHLLLQTPPIPRLRGRLSSQNQHGRFAPSCWFCCRWNFLQLTLWGKFFIFSSTDFSVAALLRFARYSDRRRAIAVPRFAADELKSDLFLCAKSQILHFFGF